MISNKEQSESWYKVESDDAATKTSAELLLRLQYNYIPVRSARFSLSVCECECVCAGREHQSRSYSRAWLQDWNVIYTAMNQLYEKRFDESLVAFGQALATLPEFEPMILSYRSLAFLALDRVQAARTDAETIIQSYPNHAEVR